PKMILQEQSSYILIKCQELSNIDCVLGDDSCHNIDNVFYRINMDHDSGSRRIYDSFVDSSLIFNDNLRMLSKLTLEFVDNDGVYFDFNDIDHSFVLEIVTQENQPEFTSII